MPAEEKMNKHYTDPDFDTNFGYMTERLKERISRLMSTLQLEVRKPLCALHFPFASGMGVWILFGPSEVGYWEDSGTYGLRCISSNSISSLPMSGQESASLPEVSLWLTMSERGWVGQCRYVGIISISHVHIPIR